MRGRRGTRAGVGAAALTLATMALTGCQPGATAIQRGVHVSRPICFVGTGRAVRVMVTDTNATSLGVQVETLSDSGGGGGLIGTAWVDGHSTGWLESVQATRADSHDIVQFYRRDGDGGAPLTVRYVVEGITPDRHEVPLVSPHVCSTGSGPFGR